MGDLGLIPGLGRFPGECNSYLLQYSGLENSMDCIGFSKASGMKLAEAGSVQGNVEKAE